jgi:hypothetical protein
MLLNHFGTFMEAPGKSTMSKGLFQNKLQCCHQVHGLKRLSGSLSRSRNRSRSLFTAEARKSRYIKINKIHNAPPLCWLQGNNQYIYSDVSKFV